MIKQIEIAADATAVLDHGASRDNFWTVKDAIEAFNRLSSEKQETAHIIIRGKAYNINDIKCAKLI